MRFILCRLSISTSLVWRVFTILMVILAYPQVTFADSLPKKCAIGQTSVVMLSTRVKQTEIPSNSVQFDFEINNYYSPTGQQFKLELGLFGEPVISEDLTITNDLKHYEKKEWTNTTGIYTVSTKGADTKREVDPSSLPPASSIPISVDEQDKSRVKTIKGQRCLEAINDQPNVDMGVCNVKVFGRSRPIDAYINSPLWKQKMDFIELKQVCVDDTMFEQPTRQWN